MHVKIHTHRCYEKESSGTKQRSPEFTIVEIRGLCSVLPYLGSALKAPSSKGFNKVNRLMWSARPGVLATQGTQHPAGARRGLQSLPVHIHLVALVSGVEDHSVFAHIRIRPGDFHFVELNPRKITRFILKSSPFLYH